VGLVGITEGTAGGRHGRPVGLVGITEATAGGRFGRPVVLVGKTEATAGGCHWRPLGVRWRAWLVRATSPGAYKNTPTTDWVPALRPPKAFISTGLFAFGLETAVLAFGRVACSRTTVMANSRRSRGGSRYGARQHQPRPARIGRGMWASGKRRRPTSDGFSQGLHASPFACTHRSVDVGRGQPASPFSCPKRSVDVARGVPASPFACTHCSVDVGRGLPASPFACAHRSVDVGRGLAASAFACPHRSVDVGRGVPASAAACATLVEVSSTTCGCPCIPKIIKSAKHPSRITIYSSIFHHLFSTFPPRVVRSPQTSLFLRFIIFYVTFQKLKFTKFLDLRLLYLYVNFWC